MQPLSKDLEQALEARFAPAERATAREMLTQYGAGPRDRHVARVREALLTLSGGRLADLGYYLAAAQHEHTSVLTWARHPAQAPRART